MPVVGFIRFADFVTEFRQHNDPALPVPVIRIEGYNKTVPSASLPITRYETYLEVAFRGQDDAIYVCRFLVGSVQVMGNMTREDHGKILEVSNRSDALFDAVVSYLRGSVREGSFRIGAGLFAEASESKCEAGNGEDLLNPKGL